MEARRSNFVYIGNVPGHEGQHTHCPRCGYLLVKMRGDRVVEVRLEGRRRLKCGAEVPIVGHVGRYGGLYRSFI